MCIRDRLSLSGLAANLLLVPLLELALLLTLAGYALLPVFGLGKLLFLLAGLLLHPLLNIIHWLASGGWATVTVGSWPLLCGEAKRVLFHRRQDAQIALDTSRVVIANIDESNSNLSDMS